ncbi:hypothetical protein MLD38_008419 [Melastoma candidum]|uniref:Uncharacterized protein n=1 Tax=Melastoma candidum TaxID=119954 RepID=A0ACB9RTE2_9MYRT|nr:hypothetical protein MLD38_008419 [Melastoma candidum]
MESRTDVMDLEVATLTAKVGINAQQDQSRSMPQQSSPKPKADAAVGGGGNAGPSFKDVLKGTSAAADTTRPGSSIAANVAPRPCPEEDIPLCPEFGGGGKLLIPPALEDYGASKWRHTLVGFLLGKAAPYPVLRKICMQLWQKKGLVEVGTINKGAIILRFDSEQHLDEIVGKADWHLAGCPLLLRKWQAGVKINEEP